MMAYSSIATSTKGIVSLSVRVHRQRSSNICRVVSQISSSSCCFCLYPRHVKTNFDGLSISKTLSCSSTGFQRSCFRSGFSIQKDNSQSLIVKCFASSKGLHNRCLEISVTCKNTKPELLVPRAERLRKNKCNIGPICCPKGFIVGLLVCYTAPEPVHAEASEDNDDEREDACDPSYVKFSHGKQVYTNYSVIEIPGDGRCLFRSVAHGACLRSGKAAPSDTRQRELADELRARVADEFIKRRKETEWFVEGDFDTYVSQMRKPHVWGGEPELFMASHVLQMPITVYMYDREAGGLISIAEYGQEYGKKNPIRVLYNGFGHYNALQIPGKVGGG